MWTLFVVVTFFSQFAVVGGVAIPAKTYTTEAKCYQGLKDLKASEVKTAWEFSDLTGKPVIVAPNKDATAGYQDITGYCLSSSPVITP
jgi:hypothetical protein